MALYRRVFSYLNLYFSCQSPLNNSKSFFDDASFLHFTEYSSGSELTGKGGREPLGFPCHVEILKRLLLNSVSDPFHKTDPGNKKSAKIMENFNKNQKKSHEHNPSFSNILKFSDPDPSFYKTDTYIKMKRIRNTASKESRNQF